MNIVDIKVTFSSLFSSLNMAKIGLEEIMFVVPIVVQCVLCCKSKMWLYQTWFWSNGHFTLKKKIYRNNTEPLLGCYFLHNSSFKRISTFLREIFYCKRRTWYTRYIVRKRTFWEILQIQNILFFVNSINSKKFSMTGRKHNLSKIINSHICRYVTTEFVHLHKICQLRFSERGH